MVKNHVGDTSERRRAAGSQRAWSLLRFIVITGLFVGPVFWWLDEATTMVGMPIFRATPMGNETVRVKQPQGGASKADKDSSNVTMHPVQVRQSSHQNLDNPSKSPNDFAKDLAQLRLALQRERDATEKLVAGLAGDLLQIQQERDKTAKVLAEPIKQVAQLRQALQNERDTRGTADKSMRELAADLAQVKQAFQREREKPAQVPAEVARDLAQLKQERDIAVRSRAELIADMAQAKKALQLEHGNTQKIIADLSKELAQVQQALRQPANAPEPTSELIAGMAQIKQALQQERENAKRTSELSADLGQIKQSLQRERVRTENLATELSQVMEALNQNCAKPEGADAEQVKAASQQQRDDMAKAIGALTADLAEVKQVLQRLDAFR